jgi:hypothetical protein
LIFLIRFLRETQMGKVIVDSAVELKFRNAAQTVEICSSSGQLLGHFVPAGSSSHSSGVEPKITEEEMARREQAGGGRSLTDILTNLEAKG